MPPEIRYFALLLVLIVIVQNPDRRRRFLEPFGSSSHLARACKISVDKHSLVSITIFEPFVRYDIGGEDRMRTPTMLYSHVFAPPSMRDITQPGLYGMFSYSVSTVSL